MFPALLCVLPFLVLKHYFIDPYFGISLSNILASIAIEDVPLTIVLIYLLTQINRFISKLLFEDKSEISTTQMLLPSSSDLMSAELRQKINEKVSIDFNLSLPTAADENANLDNAKTRIKEITHLIINKVGNGTLLLQHNIEYGFVRNLIGGSVIAAAFSLVSVMIFSFLLQNSTAFVISIIFLFVYLIPVIFSRVVLGYYSKDYAQILFREYLGNTQNKNV